MVLVPWNNVGSLAHISRLEFVSFVNGASLFLPSRSEQQLKNFSTFKAFGFGDGFVAWTGLDRCAPQDKTRLACFRAAVQLGYWALPGSTNLDHPVLEVFLDTEDLQTKNCELRRKGARRSLNENGCFPQLSHRNKSSGLDTTKKPDRGCSESHNRFLLVLESSGSRQQSAIWLWLKKDRDSLTFIRK